MKNDWRLEVMGAPAIVGTDYDLMVGDRSPVLAASRRQLPT